MNGYELVGETELDVMEGQRRLYDAAVAGIGRLLRYALRLNK